MGWHRTLRRALVTALQYYREQRGWSQTELAARSGVDQSTISRIETGVRSFARLSVQVAEHLATALGVSVEMLRGPSSRS
jgi:transcriptional regulator with XRE-family HTH domain